MLNAAILGALLLFAALFLAHVLLARLTPLAGEDGFVLAHYIVLPGLLFAGAAPFHFFGLLPARGALLCCLLLFLICSAWVASYPAVAAASPSLLIVLALRRRPGGLTAEELLEAISLKSNSLKRIDDALKDGLVRRKGERLELTRLGRALFLFFKLYRRAIGLATEPL